MKVLFFVENNWAFGKIHNELIKVLYPEIYCDIICYTKSYTIENFDLLKEKYDYFISTPFACKVLNTNYNIPYEKLIGIAHSDIDIHSIVKSPEDKDFFNKIKGYCVINSTLIKISISYGIERIPEILRIGTFSKNYPKNINEQVCNIGYFGSYNRSFDRGFDIKRGHLVKSVAEITNLPFVHRTDINFLASDMLYNNISLYMFSSLLEGLPTTAIEAMACGIPVLGTDVGIFSEIYKNGGGTILPFESHKFIQSAVDKINQFKQNPDLYKIACELSYEEGRRNDWSCFRGDWINYIISL